MVGDGNELIGTCRNAVRYRLRAHQRRALPVVRVCIRFACASWRGSEQMRAGCARSQGRGGAEMCARGVRSQGREVRKPGVRYSPTTLYLPLFPLPSLLFPPYPQQRPDHPIPRNTINQRSAGTTEACGKGDIACQLIKMTGNRYRVRR